MEIRFDAEAHDRAVRATTRAAADLDDVRRQAGRQVDRLLDGGWSGAAAAAFADAWSDWEAGAAEVSAALDSIREGLLVAGHVLTTTDVGVDETLGGLTQRVRR